ncbi:MAG: D-aminoacyl-tRNA deacylase [Planctomycetaceae bacterium]
MRAVVQRVSRASVTVDGDVVGVIQRGFLVLLGVSSDDTQDDAIYLAKKIGGLRVFEDEQGKMNLGLQDVGGAVLLVSQFTLMGDCRQGRRPSFIAAASPDMADQLYRAVAAELRGQGLSVETGKFREHMDVELVNDGPVTLLLDSRKQF